MFRKLGAETTWGYTQNKYWQGIKLFTGLKGQMYVTDNDGEMLLLHFEISRYKHSKIRLHCINKKDCFK